MNWIFLIFLIPVVLYFFLIWNNTIAWMNAEDYSPGKEGEPEGYISVIVPFRNETENIKNLLIHLNRQTLEADKYEILFIDDYSQDGLSAELLDIEENHNSIRIIKNQYIQGKKYALRTGVEYARGTRILITDADCRPGENWIRVFLEFFTEHPEAVLVSSGVLMEPEASFVQYYQALDFSALVASGASSFFLETPILCNAANLAFSKDLYQEAFDEMYPQVQTGDDIFLLLYAKKHYPDKIYFLKNIQSFTQTGLQKTWRGLIRQRLRWASKSTLYRDFQIVYVAVLVLLNTLLPWLTLCLAFFYPFLVWGFPVIFILKSLPDYIFLKVFLRYTGQERLLRFFLPAQFINLIFTPLTGIAGILQPVKNITAK